MAMHTRTVLRTLLIALLAGALLGAGSASAQPATPPGGAATPGAPAAGADLQTVAPLRGGPLDEERNRGRGPRPHEPVLLEPATVTTENATMGLSSWIAPGPPFEHRENPGGVAIGITIGWPAPRRDAPSAGPSVWQGSATR
jgi:hypothetical protein